jgi:phage-related protein
MSLNVGSLHASLTASTAAWQKSLSRALKDLDGFAKGVKRISSEIASAGAALTAVGAGAIHLAAAVDGPTKKAVDGLKQSTQLLAVQVADMLLPAVRSLTEMFRQAASVVAGLSPHTKEMISTFAVVAVQVAAAAKAFSVLSGLAGGVIGIVRAVVASAGPLLTVAAALAVVAAAVLLLHRAWRKNWGGIQDVTRDVLEWFRGAFGQFAGFMGKVWDFLVDGAAHFVDGLLSVGEVIERITGKKLGVAGLREGFAGLFKDLKSGSFFSDAFSFGKSIGVQIVDGIKEEWAAIKKELGFGGSAGTPIPLGRGMGGGGAKTSAGGTATFEGAVEFHRMAVSAGVASDAVKKLAQAFSAAEGQLVRASFRATPAGDVGLGRGLGGLSTAAKSGMGGSGAFANAQRVIDDGAKAVRERLKATGRTIASTLASTTGALGQTISNIASAASQGGPWAALLAAVMEVFQRMASFQELLKVFEYGLVRLGQFLEPLLGPIFEIVGTITALATEILAPLFSALKPLFDGVTKFAERLIPVVAAVGNIFEGLAPIIEVVGSLVGGILEALSPVLDLITGVIKGIATVLLGIMIAINEIAAAFGDQKARAEADRMKGLVDKMWAPAANELAIAEGHAARAAWENAVAQDEAAKSAQKVSESLTNVPAGYRLALARYNADMGISSEGLSHGAGVSKAGVVINGDVNISSDADTIEALGEDAKKEAARERGQQQGNPIGGGRRGGRND